MNGTAPRTHRTTTHCQSHSRPLARCAECMAALLHSHQH